MRHLYLLWLLLAANLPASSQTFQWALQTGSTLDDDGISMAADAAGNTYTAGKMGGTVDFDPGPGIYNLNPTGNYVRKLTAAGNFVWAFRISTDVINKVVLDATNAIYITGEFDNTVDFDPGPAVFNLTSISYRDAFVAKYDAMGNFIWAISMPGATGSHGNSIAVCQGAYLYCGGGFAGTVDFDPGPGVFNMTSAGLEDAFILKLDTAGNFQWARKVGTAKLEVVEGVTCDSLGNVYGTGCFGANADFDPGPATFNLINSDLNDVFIWKLDASGYFVWAKGIGSIYDDTGYDIEIDTFGCVYITGDCKSSIDFDPGAGNYTLGGFGNQDVFILKLNNNGNFIWARRLGGPSEDYCYSLNIDAERNVYMTGEYRDTADFDPGPAVYPLNSSPNKVRSFISKLDTNGVFVWAKAIESAYHVRAKEILHTATDDIYVTGSFFGLCDFDPGPGAFNLTATYSSYDAFTLKLHDCGVPAATVVVHDCDSTIVNGIPYKNSGNYVQLFNNVSGCDSNIVYQIVLHPTTYNYPNVIACDSFTVGNQTYTATGVYNTMLTSIWGCDSNITLNLIIKHSSGITLTQTACDSYTLNGQTYTSSGVYTQNFTNAVGCDSIVTLNLSIQNSNGSTINAVSCSSYTLNGQTYTNSGTYTQLYTNAAGCDSTVTLNLTINQPTAFTINQSACNTFTLNGQTYTSSGTYTQILPNANGCDSTITLNLIINYPTNATISPTVCDSLTLNGQTYYASGTYTQTLVNAAGCDSVLTINATINHLTTSSLTQTACDTFTLNGQVYTNTGIYTQQFINATGCDSILTLNLTITQSTDSLLTLATCGPYTLNGQTYNTSGTYLQTLMNAVGCDSTLTLILTITTVNTGITQAANVLTANASPANYQWLSCNPFQLISGEINQSFSPTANGDYAVIITQNSCVDTSSCFTVSGLGLAAYTDMLYLDIKPNPAYDLIHVDLGNMENEKIKFLYFINAMGQVLDEIPVANTRTNYTVDVSKYARGIYYLKAGRSIRKIVLQ